MKLNKLEKAVLEEMITRNPVDAAALNLQVKRAAVSRRENTGAGFYTYFELLDFHEVITNRIISDVYGKIDKLINPMIFVLFTESGHIKMLEGAATAENTTSIDFSKVSFEIFST
jgi:hypothetical protein